jgi:hypothetical protein
MSGLEASIHTQAESSALTTIGNGLWISFSIYIRCTGFCWLVGSDSCSLRMRNDSSLASGTLTAKRK